MAATSSRGACHIEDLDDVLDEGTAERMRVLVGFDAPAGSALTRGLDDAEAGSEIVRLAMEEREVRAGLFAGPDTHVGSWVSLSSPAAASPAPDLRAIVPALVGPALEAADGSRAASGPFLVALGPAGIGPAAVP
jgi:nucleotide-binding universal stress UspA family protein